MDAITIVIAVFILGALIFIHELGHFLAAKRVGIEVITFSIGVGPNLVSFKRGETDYCLKLIPWAGYVKLRGEEPGEEETGPGHFETRPPREKAQVLLAGPLMNLALPFLLMPLVFMLGVRVPAFLSEEPVIGWVSPESPGAEAGLRLGDKVISINGKRLSNWEELHTTILSHPDRTLSFVFLREGKESEGTLKVRKTKEGDAGEAGIFPMMEPVIGRVRKGYPADSAGMHDGDRVLTVNGSPIRHWAEMAQIIRKNPNRTLAIGIERKGVRLSVNVTPREDSQAGGGLIGVEREDRVVIKKMGVGRSIIEGWKQIGRYSSLVFYVLWKLICGEVSLNSLGGPIAITDFTAQAARSGLSRLMDFISFISLQLGILNLFPFPVLDGGLLLIILVEAITGRQISIRKKEISRYIGFAFLLALMVLVTINDIIRTWGDDIVNLYRAIMRAIS